MKKLNSIFDLMSETGLYKQQMYGYKEKDYTLQVFVACEDSWFYVIIYDENDEVIGVCTFITEGTQTMHKIKYAKNYKIVKRLLDKLIKIKESEYVNRRLCRDVE